MAPLMSASLVSVLPVMALPLLRLIVVPCTLLGLLVPRKLTGRLKVAVVSLLAPPPAKKRPGPSLFSVTGDDRLVVVLLLLSSLPNRPNDGALEPVVDWRSSKVSVSALTWLKFLTLSSWLVVSA